MATWGGLNKALTSFRNGLMRRFPNKDTRTDGARADKVHGATSEHQEDPDGTVDAYDCDVNWFRSSDPDGNTLEDRISEAVKADFMADPRSRLWIHNRQISNKNVQNAKVRTYTGKSPHTEHIHFETIQRLEDDGSEWKFPRTDALLREMRGEEPVTEAEMNKIADKVVAKVWAATKNVNVGPRAKDANGKPRAESQQQLGNILSYLSPEVAAVDDKVEALQATVNGMARSIEDLRRLLTEKQG